MLSCLKKLKTVFVLVILAVFSQTIFASETIDIVDHQLRVKVIKQELWHKGIQSPSEKDSSPKKDNVIYFPEELELALRLISS